MENDNTQKIAAHGFTDEALRGYGAKYLDAIRGKLAADYAQDDSDAELERVLGPCVGGHFLVPAAKRLRDDGVQLIDPDAPKQQEPYEEPEECEYFRERRAAQQQGG